MFDDEKDIFNKKEETSGQEDIFAEEDVQIPEGSDNHVYRKVTVDGKLSDTPTGEFHQEAQPEQEEPKRAQSVHSESQNETRQEENRYSYIPNEPKQEENKETFTASDKGNDHKKKWTGSGKGGFKPYGKAIACGLIVGVIGGGCVLGSFAIGSHMGNGNASVASADIKTNEAKLSSADYSGEDEQVTTTASKDSGKEYTVAEISEQCKSSVVAITNKGVSEVQTIFGTMQEESEGSGSGVIIGKTDSELLIATNNHVVEGAEELTVCFNDDENAVYSAQIKGTDSDNDLAVIAIPLSDIDADVLNTVSIATIGDSDDMEVGDEVVAIGNALGLGQSVTSGVISATSREVTIDDVTATLMQTDAAINPGNSGGALFNMKGELIGINSAKYASSEVEGMGFAIPMSTAQPIIEDLMNQETKTKLDSDYGFLNIYPQDISSDAIEMYGIPEGVYVGEVNEGGAAANAGMEAGDIITSIDGVKVTSVDELKTELQYLAAGETVEVVIQRNGDNGYEEQTLNVTLDNASEQSTSTTTQDSQQSGTEDQQGTEDGSSMNPFSGNSGSYFSYGDGSDSSSGGNSGMQVNPFQ